MTKCRTKAETPPERPVGSPKEWWVYLLKCDDASLYCGVTKDIKMRLSMHNRGKASKYTRSRLPVSLYASRGGLCKQDAFRLEFKIKQTPAALKKELLETWSLDQ